MVTDAGGSSMSCEVCDEITRVGWLTQPGSHCRRCCRSWMSKKQAHCPTCCAHFSTPNLFDAHLLTRGGCQDPATVTRPDGSPRFRQDESGLWRDSERWNPDVPRLPRPLTRDGLGGGVQYLSPETPPNAAEGHTAADEPPIGASE